MSKIPVDLPPDPYPQPVVKRGAGSGLGGSSILLFALSFVATFALVWLLLEIF